MLPESQKASTETQSDAPLPVDAPVRSAESASRRSSFYPILLALLVLGVAASAAVVWYVQQGQLAAAETDAKARLKKLGGLLVSGDSGHVGSANFALVRSQENFVQAMQLTPQLVWLEVLDLSGKPVTSDQLAQLAPLTQLGSLHLAKTQLDDAAAAHLTQFPALGALHLSETNLTEAALASISKLTSLKVLDLSETQITGNMAPLSRLTELQWLVLRDLPLSDDAIETLASHPSLKRLTLNPGQITEQQYKNLRRNVGLQVDGMDPEKPPGQ